MRRKTQTASWSLVAACAALLSCANVERPVPERHADRYFVRPTSSSTSHKTGRDPFGYGLERSRILALLADAEEPLEAADLTMRLADLAEETRRRVSLQLDDPSRRTEADRTELELLDRELADEEVRLLDRVVRGHPDYRRVDEALYRLGCAMLDHDQPDEALRHIRTLLAAYPDSPYVPHGYLAFADSFFAAGELDKARELYEKVLAFRDTEASPLAHYKLGWCWMNTGDYATALESFVEAVSAAELSNRPVAATVREEALKDLVRAYAHAGQGEKAEAFFERLAPDRVEDLLDRLAGVYLDSGRFQDSIEINQRLIERVGCSAARARAQVAVFEARLFLGEVESVQSETRRLVEIFVELGRCLPTVELRSLAAASASAKQAIQDQAARYRREYESTKEPAAAQMADDLELMAESF